MVRRRDGLRRVRRAHAAFTLKTGYNLCDATMHYDPDFLPAGITKSNDTPERRWGIFGRVNVSTKFGEIRDGLSNTIMTGELQRITEHDAGEQGRLGDRRAGHALYRRRDVSPRWHNLPLHVRRATGC